MCYSLRRFLTPLVLLTSLCLSAAALMAATFKEAAAAAGDPAQAADSWQELIRSEGASAARLYNLGNALTKLGRSGPAVLAYERAALLDPRSADIRNNLRLARESAGQTGLTSPSDHWRHLFRWLSLREWSALTLTGVALIAAASLAWGLRGFSSAPVRRAILAAVGAGVLITSLAGLALHQRRSEADIGILTAAEPVLRLSPFAEADPVASLTAGQRVILGQSTGGWTWLTVPDSEKGGWLPDSDVTPLIPRS